MDKKKKLYVFNVFDCEKTKRCRVSSHNSNSSWMMRQMQERREGVAGSSPDNKSKRHSDIEKTLHEQMTKYDEKQKKEAS